MRRAVCSTLGLPSRDASFCLHFRPSADGGDYPVINFSSRICIDARQADGR